MFSAQNTAFFPKKRTRKNIRIYGKRRVKTARLFLALFMSKKKARHIPAFAKKCHPSCAISIKKQKEGMEMTEVMKEGKLPKNIRQIGQAGGNQKVYIEDYVITYLKQVPQPDETMRIIILYGKKEMKGDELCWFVSGAVGAEKDFFMEKTVIDQDSWQKVNELAGRFFPDLTVLGWAVAGDESVKSMEEQILRTQKQFFRPDQKLFFSYNTEEKTETVSFYEKGKWKQQTGYYIYYDRNECMQNYMVSLRAAERHPEEFEADRAAHQFRMVSVEKKTELHRKRTAALMTCVSLVLVMVIMVIGITMLNNYEKMQSMEQVLYQISGKVNGQTQPDSLTGTDIETAAADTGIAETTTDSAAADTGIAETTTDSAAADTESAETTHGSDGKDVGEKTTGTSSASGDAAQNKPNTDKEETAQTEENGQSRQDDTEEKEKDGKPQQTAEEDGGQAKADAQDGTEEMQTNQGDAQAETATSQQTTYIIQKGDTLAKICMRYYGNLSNIDLICEMNGIENKDNILYGQKIILP